jgi:hypothetical protein
LDEDHTLVSHAKKSETTSCLSKFKSREQIFPRVGRLRPQTLSTRYNLSYLRYISKIDDTKKAAESAWEKWTCRGQGPSLAQGLPMARPVVEESGGALHPP